MSSVHTFYNGCNNLHSCQQWYSLFSPSFSELVISCLFDSSHSDSFQMISHCGFALHFPDDSWCWTFSRVPVDHLFILFGKMSIQFLSPFFLLDCFFCCCCWYICDLYIFWMLTPCWKYDLQISSSFCWLFPFLCWSLLINVVPFIYFCFCFPCLWNQVQKTSLRLVSRGLVLDICRGFTVSSMSFKL